MVEIRKQNLKPLEKKGHLIEIDDKMFQPEMAAVSLNSLFMETLLFQRQATWDIDNIPDFKKCNKYLLHKLIFLSIFML